MMQLSPVEYSGEPSHNRLPVAGAALWWPLHGALTSALTPVASLVEEVVEGAAHATPWGTPGYYTLPADNGGGTDAVVLTGAHVAEDYLDAVLGLADAPIGTQVIVVVQAGWVDQADDTGVLWCYGADDAFSGYALGLTTADAPVFISRGVGGTAAVTTALSDGTGDAATAFAGEGGTALVLSIHVTAAMTLEVELHIGSAVGSGVWAPPAAIVVGNDATALPGRAGEETDHGGLVLGAMALTAAGRDRFWGRGATNTGLLGNWCARRFSEYDSTRAAAVLTDLVARPDDIPRPFLD